MGLQPLGYAFLSEPQNPNRSLLLPGLRLAVTRPGPLLWTYAANLTLALVFSWRLHTQLSALLDHSLAAQRLTASFDLGTALAALQRTSRDVPPTGISSFLGIPLYLAVYFLLVPGALFVYRTAAPSGLSTLLQAGARFFWRFVRITLLTLVFSLAILAPLAALAGRWSAYWDRTHTGLAAVFIEQLGWLLVLIIAALLRLYFDLVEVYTVQLADQLRPSGQPDRRVRRTLLPALRTLVRNFLRAFATFLTLLLAGLAAFVLLTRIAVHTLAQPRSWPLILLTQLALFFTLFTRYAQRAAETILATDNPLPAPVLQPTMPLTPEPTTPPDLITPQNPKDAIPNPEPAVPSLSEPDPAIYHPN